MYDFIPKKEVILNHIVAEEVAHYNDKDRIPRCLEVAEVLVIVLGGVVVGLRDLVVVTNPHRYIIVTTYLKGR